ncbi:MAG: GGDEF domain-containing protein [Trueperaceae bacterium]|nr:GGDEF domain-containing protein [Trueperaceae bacterium]
MLKILMPPESYSRQEKIRFYVYAYATLIGTPKLLFSWYFIRAEDPFARLTYPALALYTFIVFLALVRKRSSLVRLERQTLIVLGVFWLTRAVHLMFIAQDVQMSEAIQAIYFSYVLFCVLVYLMFDNTTALRISVLTYVVSFVLSLAQVRFAPIETTFLEALQFEAYLAVIIGGIHALSYIKTELSESQARAEAFEQLAYQDSLTGLWNRRRIYACLQQHIEIAERYQRPLSIVLLDIDHFKHINDTYGHDVGDLILKEFAKLFTPLLRKADAWGRWGGEEFLVVCHETPLEEAEQFAGRLCQTLAASTFPKVAQVTASFGVVSLRPGQTADELLCMADALLYEAKRAGRNQVKSISAKSSLLPA